MDKSNFKPGALVKVVSPFIKKHKKFKGMIGKVRSVIGDMDEHIDCITTVFVDFPYNNKCSFEFLEEELEYIGEEEKEAKEEVKEEPKKERKYHKARQDDLKKDDVPIINSNNLITSNKVASVRIEDNEPWTEQYVAQDADENFVKDYILGNVFRPTKTNDPEPKYDIERAIFHRIYSLYDKQRDWANIERGAYNWYRKDVFSKSGDYDTKDWRKNALGDKRNILRSKFEGWYYRFQIGGDRFFLRRAIIPSNENEPEAIFERVCIDYAMGNFFTSEKDAKRSVLFQKLKTFFKFEKG